MADLGQIALGARKMATKRREVNIIEFIEAKWGLGGTGFKLFPVQRIILKAHYGLALDDNPHGFDLTQPIPVNHPEYEEWAGPVELDLDGEVVLDPNGDPIRYYKWRVSITDWRRENEVFYTEAGYLRHLFKEGRSNIKEVVPGEERRELILSIGRRSGKTFLASCIAAYETYKLIAKDSPQMYYGMPAGGQIQIISVATGIKQAGLLYQDVSSHFVNCPFFSPYTANNTMSYARFQTPADIERYGSWSDNEKAKATIMVTFAPCIAKSLRGPANLVVIFDEIAHFGQDGQSSAKDVYEAATPSTATFSRKSPHDRRKPIGPVEGRIIQISTPMGQQGMFYKMFRLGFRGGIAAANILSIQAPTWEVNPTVPASQFEKEYLKDATAFFTEFGGVFTSRSRGWIEKEKDLQRCIVSELRPRTRAKAREPHFLGFDLGLAGDGSAIAIGHLVGGQDPYIVVDKVDQIRAGEGKYEDYDRLEFDEVADWIYDYSKRFFLVEGIFDQHAGIPLEQALVKRGLRQMKKQLFTPTLRTEVFDNFKHMIWDARIQFYNHPISENEEYCGYLRELLDLQVFQVSRHVRKVEAPNVEGKYDDQSDALARMVWLASQHMTNPRYIAKGSSAGSNARSARRNYKGIMTGVGRPVRGGTSPDRQFFGKRRK